MLKYLCYTAELRAVDFSNNKLIFSFVVLLLVFFNGYPADSSLIKVWCVLVLLF